MANQHSIHELLGIVADPETPEARDAAWNSIVEQLQTYEKTLRWIERCAYDHHQQHTMFTHIQRRAMAVLNPAINPEASERDRSGDETSTTQVSPSAYLPGHVGGDDQASRSEASAPARELAPSVPRDNETGGSLVETPDPAKSPT